MNTLMPLESDTDLNTVLDRIDVLPRDLRTRMSAGLKGCFKLACLRPLVLS